MLQLQNINFSIGHNHLIQNAQWIINPKKRVALIGSNGAGKTTLFRIIAGEITNFEGSIIKPKGYQIGYLPQEEIAIKKGNVLTIVLEGHDEILKIEEEMDAIHQILETNSQSDGGDILDQLGILESRYNVLGGYTLESQAKKILMGLGFSESDFHRPISELSGGWQMRVYLARLLLQEPDVLLLDEPTNHLDLESLEWIESYLRNFSGSMVIISHDRYFIDRLAQEIVELDRGKLTLYSGGYQFYKQKKELEQEQLIKKWEEQKEERIRIQRFIDRFRYKNTKAAQVQSRIKMLEKMETIELPESSKTIHFKIQADTVSFKEALQIKHLAFRYTESWVLQDINLNMYRGEKVALVGVNGAGKTTLTRLISKELRPQQGELKLGERVHVGYYAQHQIDSLNLNNTIYKEVEETAARSFHPKLRDILGIFQFTSDTVEKSLGVLSGGEKARVSLAKILLSPCNFLIMDEPTNHLDLTSKEALEHALKDYDGTLLLISHDRYFLDRLVNRVIELKNGQLKEYEGNYSDYLNKREQEKSVDATAAIKQTTTKTEDSAPGRLKKTKEQKQKEAEARQAVSKERNRLQKYIEKIEHDIEHLEKQKKERFALI
ncbi:MAG: ABC-F family ATP-binding cassette domain-containing protein [Calditrichaceae bacterium]